MRFICKAFTSGQLVSTSPWYIGGAASPFHSDLPSFSSVPLSSSSGLDPLPLAEHRLLLLELCPRLAADPRVICFRTETGFGDGSGRTSHGAVGSAVDDGTGEAANPIFKALKKV